MAKIIQSRRINRRIISKEIIIDRRSDEEIRSITTQGRSRHI